MIGEYESVELTVAIDGFTVGSRGTIVAIYADGQAYEVEFDEPRHGLATVPIGSLNKRWERMTNPFEYDVIPPLFTDDEGTILDGEKWRWKWSDETFAQGPDFKEVYDRAIKDGTAPPGFSLVVSEKWESLYSFRLVSSFYPRRNSPRTIHLITGVDRSSELNDFVEKQANGSLLVEGVYSITPDPDSDESYIVDPDNCSITLIFEDQTDAMLFRVQFGHLL